MCSGIGSGAGLCGAAKNGFQHDNYIVHIVYTAHDSIVYNSIVQ
jgi:hypothetical protein